jgi:hypothetical protein
VYHFCTYFDRTYLLRGLTLYRSLKAHVPEFVLWVLCFDGFTYDVLSRLDEPALRPVSLEQFESGDEELLKAKPTRSRIEYYFTCSPSWPLYIMNGCPEVDLITYLDADLYFYSGVSPVFDELGSNSILIVAHRFPERLRRLEKHGIYNVGLLAFRNDVYGRQCLQWWRARCLEWCYDRLEDGRYADQKYLDDWPQRFARVVVLQHGGAGLAPWNWMACDIRTHDGQTTVDGQPLIFYHFEGVKILSRRLYDPGVGKYRRMPLALRRRLYAPYMQAMLDTWRWVRAIAPEVDLGIASSRPGPHRMLMFARRMLQSQLMLMPSLKEQSNV